MKGWHWTKTLLGCPPDADINRRHLYYDEVKVATFNRGMAIWPSDNDRELDILCETLNENFVDKEAKK